MQKNRRTEHACVVSSIWLQRYVHSFLVRRHLQNFMSRANLKINSVCAMALKYSPILRRALEHGLCINASTDLTIHQPLGV
jgi:hypothetical protein